MFILSNRTSRNLSVLAGTCIAATAVAQPSFTAMSSLITAQRPSGVAAADFNGDGLADLAVAVDTIDRIDVFFGTGGGAFGPAMPIFTGGGTGPDALVAADANGDGQPDLVVVLKNINAVRVYTNNAGAFAAGSQASTGDRPVSLAAADIDNDGDTDFVTANRDGNSITVLTNTSGVLSAATVAIGDEPRFAQPIDLAGDGQMEIAVSSSRDRTVYVLASGTLAVQQSINVGPVVRPEGLAAADTDGDGDADLIVVLSDDAFSAIGVMANSLGTLGAPVTTPTTGQNSSSVVAADFDLDGDVDLATTNSDSGNITIFGNSGGMFAATQTIATGAQPSGLVAADLDGNGSPDLAVSNRDSNSTSLLLSDAAAANCTGDIADDLGNAGADGQVSFGDFLALLGLIGPCPGGTPGCTGDIADDSGNLGGDGQVSFGDFLALLGLIGPC